MNKKLLTTFLVWVACCVSIYAQDRKVSGKVTSAEDGSGLPGVSVQLKGSAKGTTTDASGNYSLAVPSTATTIVYSFVGMTPQEISIGTKSVIDVKLGADTKQLTEIVVTAIGIQRDKKALAYAVSSVKGDALAQRSEPDALRSLNGKVPGVNIISGGGAPGQGTKITIRGNNSFTGNNQPLFVVDGIPFDNSVNSTDGYANNTVTSNRAYDIDPNNIESMTVLKGAAAAALYGSRASNGVIVITTKSGSKSVKKGLEVTVNSSASIENLSTVPDYQDTYTQGSNQIYNGGFIGNWGTVFPSQVDRVNAQLGFARYSKTIVDGYPEGTVPHPLVGVAYGAARYKSVFPQFLDANGNAIAVPLQPYDIVGGFFRQGKVIENGISIASTGDKTSLNAGISRMQNDGIIPNSNTSRTSLNFGGNATLTNGLIVSGNVNYVLTTQQSPQSGASFFSDYGSGSTGSIYDRLFYLPRNYNLNGYPFENPVDGTNVFYRALDNPLRIVKYNLYNSTVNRVYGNMALSYDVTPWLNLLAKGGINTYSETRTNVIRPGGNAVPLGSVSKSSLVNTETDYTFLATVSHDFSDKIAVKVLLGANANERQFSRVSTTGQDVIDPNLLILNGTKKQSSTQYNSLRRLYGIFGEATVSYNNYAFLTASVRNDHSSTLPVANSSYLYPAVSGSFVFSDAFNLPKTVLSFGKIRANYAKVGKDASPYQVNTVYNLGTTYIQDNPIATAGISSTLNNVDLKPEFTTEVEVGTELQFFNNRIGIDLAYFDRNSTDLIVQTRVPSSSGFAYRNINAGKINNNGIELGLTLVPIKTKSGFTWTSFAAFTRLRSLVVDAGPAGEIFLGGATSNLGTIHRNGEPFGMIYGSKYARDANGNYLINEASGHPIYQPQPTLIGNPAPDFTLGWTNTFTFKNFTLSALLDYRKGGKMYSVTAASLLLRGQLKGSEDREGLRVIPGVYGDPQTYQAILGADGQTIRNTTAMTAFEYHFSDGFGAYGADETNVYDITTIRIREVTLGYSVPKAFLKKNVGFIGSLRISLSGRNLWFYAPNMLKGLNFDPEVLSNFPDSNIQGFDLGAAPSTRRFGVNLSATF
ncbi:MULTISPECIES: SusC/RagA family TonB-linked outer membrane protein [unclassified Arcicella]|uniref:SusC/RagA family TonB-linked outer membrane protein n=1 Tax=unclassified Arcicella TaxID=2644986 RepID=UPI0028573F6A|nr:MULTISPECIES: SusC/RagA family TonB-linked outer membrane protein [unclassified Arcicella]MDR6563478.1 TonB-linked SusC/RagA family outer membrane protein [Arcicella sp. BE51]MDR6813410.1 TonB-linked SusC/RagA family outer membrane protein [Arcicella sp. BE140]MDR6824723.1 TonB-linked SusC/RagA family outer membrane protein [Arcicella sp. BE139]